MTETNTPPASLVQSVTTALAEGAPAVDLTTEQVTSVIVAYETFKAGEPAGTLKRDPDTGAFALRVDDPNQGPCWKVTTPDGSQHTDMQPTLPTWTVVS